MREIAKKDPEANVDEAALAVRNRLAVEQLRIKLGNSLLEVVATYQQPSRFKRIGRVASFGITSPYSKYQTLSMPVVSVADDSDAGQYLRIESGPNQILAEWKMAASGDPAIDELDGADDIAVYMSTIDGDHVSDSSSLSVPTRPRDMSIANIACLHRTMVTDPNDIIWGQMQQVVDGLLSVKPAKG